ncbi:hypothetical protein B0H13DRAFT_2497606 [Mycena leptocephala]|nr:hypothetical protein B0H13DRAFT_2497606 [Mycena leptocephala]
MSTTTAPVTDTAGTSLPNAANAAASLPAPLHPLTHTDTVILTPEPSVADVDVDLGAFFDNRPSASGANATMSASTPITPSLPPTPDHARPVLAGPMREFIDSVGLSDLPPKDKRFDGKVEVRQLGRELHSLTQQTARMRTGARERVQIWKLWFNAPGRGESWIGERFGCLKNSRDSDKSLEGAYESQRSFDVWRCS